MKRLFLLSIVLMMLGGVGFSAEIHVSKSGNDANAGTSGSPFLTIQKAASTAVAGDVIVIHAGTYRETVTPANSGSAGNPIIFKAAEGDKVVISATESVNNWTSAGNNIYKASVTMPLGIEKNAFFYDGDMMDIARWPNNADNDPFTVDANYITAGSGSHIEYSGIPSFDWSNGYMWYLGGHSGASWTRKITSTTTSRVNFEGVDITKWPFNPHNPTITRNGHKGIFYLFNSKDALDIEREYYYDSSAKEIYFKAPSNANPSSGDCQYRAREYTIKLSSNYIVLDGIETFGGIILVTGDNNTIKNSTIRHGIPVLDELNNTDAQIGSGSITVEGSHTLIEKNLIEYGTANGISMLASWKGSVNTTIRNNVVRYFNTLGIHAEPIRSNCSGTVIENNTVYGGGRSGIYVSGSDAVVSYNDCYDVMKINADGGVFYTVGNANRKNSVINHNWFHDSQPAPHAGYKIAGIYLDNHSKGYDVHHNVVWNVSWSGIQINWDNWYLNFYNNSIYNVKEGMGRWENGYTLDQVVLINNYASIGPWYGTDIQAENIINANNPFTSVSNKNFMPANSSYLIDAGKAIPGFTDGFVGSAPDIGAYEKGGVQWVPGADWVPATGENTVEIASSPGSVVTGQSFDVQVNYSSVSQNSIVVAINDPSGNWVTNAIENVNAGSGTATITLNSSTALAVADNYTLGVSIRPLGTGFESNYDYKSTTFNVIASAVSTIDFNSTPSSVTTGDDLVVVVDYEAASDLEVVAIINDPSGVWLANDIELVNTGSGTKTLTVSQGAGWTVENGYNLGIAIRPVGGAFADNLDYKSATFNVTSASSTFFIINKQTGKKIRQASLEDGQALELVPSSWAGDPTRWTKVDTDNGYFYLQNVLTGSYFRPADDLEDAILEQRPTSYNGSYTQWKQVASTGDYFYLENRATGMYFRPETDADYSPIVQKPSSWNGDWTQWMFVDVNSGAALKSGQISTDVSGEVEGDQVVIYPNPVNTQSFTIETSVVDETVIVGVFDIQGKQIYNTMSNASRIEVPVTSFAPGIYIVKVKTNTKVITKKLKVK